MATRQPGKTFSMFDLDGTARPAPAESPEPMTVSVLIAKIRGALAEAFEGRVTVVGELSGVNRPASGHVYFRLKDAECAVEAVMFRSAAAKLKFDPADGLEVIVQGRVDVYDARGQLQIYAERMTPGGQGALELAFRQLTAKLRAEGLFDPAAKKPVRRFPRAIGVVTSPTGAAIRDIRRSIQRRWPAARVYLAPTPVQGEAAAAGIAECIGLLDSAAEQFSLDTIIVARGGGSLEDLWAFNEEVVARAIFAAKTPVISGVGHEVDVTISDLVADVRAATPTAAAELAVPDRQEVRRTVSHLAARATRRVTEMLAAASSAVAAALRSAVFRDPTGRVRTCMQRTDELSGRLLSACRGLVAGGRKRLEPVALRLAALHPAGLAERRRAGLERLTHRLAWSLGKRSKQAGDAVAAVDGRLAACHPRHRLALASQRVQAAERQLEAMGYRNVLGRGYTVTRCADGRIIRTARGAAVGAEIETETGDGRFWSKVRRRAGRDGETLAAEKRPPKPKKQKQTRKDDSPGLFDLAETDRT